MTICVAVKVGEGLVMAADSATILEGTAVTAQGTQTGVLQAFSYANKVMQVKDYPIAVMSWGIASIRDRSIQSLVMEFEYDYKSIRGNSNYTVRQVADDLLSFIRSRYDDAFHAEPKKPVLGLFIGGYSARQFFAEEYFYEFPQSADWVDPRPNQPDGRPSFGANWYGQTNALTRLIRGVDVAALSELVKRGVDKNLIQKWVDDGVTEYPLVFDGMPIQDAIDFAEYAINITIGWFRFGLGPPLCGGDIDIGVITPMDFQWAKRKQWAIKA